MLLRTVQDTFFKHLMPCDMDKLYFYNKHLHEWKRFVQFKDFALEMP